MENTLFVTADKVASDLGVSKPYAYKLVRQMNDELNAKGFLDYSQDSGHILVKNFLRAKD